MNHSDYAHGAVNPEKQERSIVEKALDFVEKSGNKLPHPVTLFAIFGLLVIVLSYLLSFFDISATHPGTGENIKLINLLSRDGIRLILTQAVNNFTSFAPLGTVLVAMLGVGLAEKSGLVGVMLRKLVLSVPSGLITATVVLAGIMSNMASDAGYIILVPLGAIVFLAEGRHPIAGLAAAFAGVSGGFSANLLITTLDPLLGGLTSEAAGLLDPSYNVLPTANWFFMVASTLLVTVAGVYVTEKIIEPRLGPYCPESQQADEIGSCRESGDEIHAPGAGSATDKLEQISDKEAEALKKAGISLLLFLAVVAALIIPENGLLRSDAGNIFAGLPPSPFVSSMVLLIALAFFVPALTFGICSGSIRSDKDLADQLSETMSTMGGYIVLAFVAAQFIKYFDWSNMGQIMSIKGAEFLQAANFTGLPLIVMFIVISSFLNIFIGSASAKWAIMAPVFVPMLMMLGYSPEATQLAYRIGDSTTNIISPLMPYFPIVIAFAERYQKNIGIGTLVSIMLPYSVMFLISWVLLLVIWLLLGIPIGPGAPVQYMF